MLTTMRRAGLARFSCASASAVATSTTLVKAATRLKSSTLSIFRSLRTRREGAVRGPNRKPLIAGGLGIQNGVSARPRVEMGTRKGRWEAPIDGGGRGNLNRPRVRMERYKRLQAS